MSAVTLTDIKAAQDRLAEMIAAFEQQPAAKRLLLLPETEIPLAPGERYAGAILAADGSVSHHLVLLPDRGADLTWDAAVEFAKAAGGELPTRREQSLLFANLKDQFEAAWYWSGEQHESNGSYAWYQNFRLGYQDNTPKSYEGRAVAVRRLPA
ncbi:MAG: DUF1566 domain-containing protein [Pseudomonadota bacterium]